jgi:hypothetical protein
MKTIAEQLNIKEFPFKIKDKDGNTIYWENSNGYWEKREYNSNGRLIYYEDPVGSWARNEYDSNGDIADNRPKSTCEGKVVEIDGKKYELKEVK